MCLPAGAQTSAESTPEVLGASELFTLHLDLPEGSRVDFLRIYYYDTSPIDSQAWLTTYNGAGSFSNLTSLTSSGNTGYGSALSGLLQHVVNNVDSSYALNWRANEVGSTMRLCGFRIAYRLPENGGWSALFSYVNVSGSTLRPRQSNTGWSYAGVGCISVVDPVVFPDGFESGNTSAWSITNP